MTDEDERVREQGSAWDGDVAACLAAAPDLLRDDPRPISSEGLKNSRSKFPVRYTHDDDGTPLKAVVLHASGVFLHADDEDPVTFVDGER